NSRRNGGAFRLRRFVDRAVLSFHLQGGSAYFGPDERPWHRRQDAVGAHVHGLFCRWAPARMGQSPCVASLSQSVVRSETALRTPDVLVGPSLGSRFSRATFGQEMGW